MWFSSIGRARLPEGLVGFRGDVLFVHVVFEAGAIWGRLSLVRESLISIVLFLQFARGLCRCVAVSFQEFLFLISSSFQFAKRELMGPFFCLHESSDGRRCRALCSRIHGVSLWLSSLVSFCAVSRPLRESEVVLDLVRK